MKDHTEQQLDKLANKVMQSSLLESPSLDFTANVMAKVEAYAKSKTTIYEPLISKKWWLLISLLVIGLFSYGFFGTGLESLGWFDKVDYSILSNNKVTEAISGITISKIFMYAIGFFGLVFFVQIPIMKHYLDRRFTV